MNDFEWDDDIPQRHVVTNWWLTKTQWLKVAFATTAIAVLVALAITTPRLSYASYEDGSSVLALEWSGTPQCGPIHDEPCYLTAVIDGETNQLRFDAGP